MIHRRRTIIKWNAVVVLLLILIFVETADSQARPRARSCGPCCPLIANGQVDLLTSIKNNAFAGDTVYYRCLPGYAFVTPYSTTQCRTNGTWSPLPVCRGSDAQIPAIFKTKCYSDPPTVANAAVVLQSFKANNTGTFVDFVRYQCANGYNLTTDIDYVMCTANGRWSNPPICQDLRAPVVVSNNETLIAVMGPVSGAQTEFTDVRIKAKDTSSCDQYLGWAIAITVIAAFLLLALIIMIIVFFRYWKTTRRPSFKSLLCGIHSPATEPEPEPQRPAPRPVEAPKPVVVVAAPPPPPTPVQIIAIVKKVEIGINTDPLPAPPPPKPVEVEKPVKKPPEKKLANAGTMTEEPKQPKRVVAGVQTDDVFIIDEDWLINYREKVIAEWEASQPRKQEEDEEDADEEKPRPKGHRGGNHYYYYYNTRNKKGAPKKKRVLRKRVYYSGNTPIVSVVYKKPQPADERRVRLSKHGGDRIIEVAHKRPKQTLAPLSIGHISSSADMQHQRRFVIDHPAVEAIRDAETHRRLKQRPSTSSTTTDINDLHIKIWKGRHSPRK